MTRQLRVPCPRWFRRYLLDGDHWRAGKRVQGEFARFTGLVLHAGRDEEQGPMAFAEGFVEYLEQALVDDRVERTIKTTVVNYRRVVAAMREVEADRPDEMTALRYYLVPTRRRGLSVVQQADAQGVSVDALRDAAERGVLLVWEELGGVWLGEAV